MVPTWTCVRRAIQAGVEHDSLQISCSCRLDSEQLAFYPMKAGHGAMHYAGSISTGTELDRASLHQGQWAVRRTVAVNGAFTCSGC